MDSMNVGDAVMASAIEENVGENATETATEPSIDDTAQGRTFDEPVEGDDTAGQVVQATTSSAMQDMYNGQGNTVTPSNLTTAPTAAPSQSLFAPPTLSSFGFAAAYTPSASAAFQPSVFAQASRAFSNGTDVEAEAMRLRDREFDILTNNHPSFKYKYPQANPTPPGEDDVVWNKVYTAADSRYYNYGGKSATASAKKRESGETRDLALRMIRENREKRFDFHLKQLRQGDSSTTTSTQPTTSMAPKKTAAKPTKKSESNATEEDYSGVGGMSISDKVKTQSRAAKKPTNTPPTAGSSKQGTPAPSASAEMTGTTSTKSAAPKKAAPGSKKPATAATKITAKKPISEQSAKMAQRQNAKINGTASTAGPSDVGSPASTDDGGEYCVCRKPDDHRLMIRCEGQCGDGTGDWYHADCMGIDETDGRNLIDKFVCPTCTIKDEYFTTWKRMCRCNNIKEDVPSGNCRKPARVSITPPSKYCSHECARNYWQYVLKRKLRQDNAPSLGGALSFKEVCMLAARCKTVADWRALQEKPRVKRQEGDDPDRRPGLDYLTEEDVTKMAAYNEEILANGNEIELYQGQLALLKMIVARMQAAKAHPDVANQDICGFDNRIAMNTFEYKEWANTVEGLKARAKGKLGSKTEEVKKMFAIVLCAGEVAPPEPDLPDELKDMCLKGRKKCKHMGWINNHGHDFKGMVEVLAKNIEKLRAKEAEVVDDAEYREATSTYDARNKTIVRF